MKKSIKKSIWIYIFFFFSIFLFYKIWNLEQYKIPLILGFILIFIKDILLYLFEIKEKLKISYNLKQIFSDSDKWKIKWSYLYLFLNRNYFFPFILVLYLVFLLISQTKIFWLNNLEIFKNINSNVLLSITIFSWILTIFKEEKDEEYKIEKITSYWIWLNILLTIWLSILWTYIIFNQVIKLGFLSYPISIISGILIFLVWISILEDDENLENNN
jgi:hypothetical protein